MTGTRTDRGVAPAQQAPLPVAVDQDASLVEDPVQKQRRVGLHALQVGDVDRTDGDALQADCELDPAKGRSSASEISRSRSEPASSSPRASDP